MFRSSFLRRAKTAFDTFCSSSLINSKSSNIHGVARRFYPTNHFQIVRRHRWFKNHRAVVSSIAVVLGATTIYSQSLETIPYLRRTRFLIVPKCIERKACEWVFDDYKEQHRDEILPSEHPESIRIRRISEEMLEALRSDLREERVWEHSKTSEEEQKKRRKSMIRYLEGMSWEFIVVRDPEVNAMNIAPGKIVVLTGLLDSLKSDAEIAFTIGHEVGHTVARNTVEGITKFGWFKLLDLIVNVGGVIVFFWLPFLRRGEFEAEYIGLMLVASAGYDPRVSLTVNEKLNWDTIDMAPWDEYLHTHPSGHTVKRFLTQTHIMEPALAIYKQKISSDHEIERKPYGLLIQGLLQFLHVACRYIYIQTIKDEQDD